MGNALIPEPKCPDCGVGVIRPKCMFDLGGDCPRHEIRREWERDCRKLLAEMRSSDAGDVPMEVD